MVQDLWRRHVAWRRLVSEEEARARAEAERLKQEYLFAGKSREELRAMRRRHAFMHTHARTHTHTQTHTVHARTVTHFRRQVAGGAPPHVPQPACICKNAGCIR